MGAPENIRQRLLWFKEQGEYNFTITIGRITLRNIMRMDFSNANYGKIETLIGYAGYGNMNSAQTSKPVVTVFSYEAVEQISTVAYNLDLSSQVSAQFIPLIQPQALTNYTTLQGMASLQAPKRTQFHLYLGTDCFETIFDYSVANPNYLTCVIPWIDMNTLAGMNKVDVTYGAISQIHINYDVYGHASPWVRETALLPTTQIVLPWE